MYIQIFSLVLNGCIFNYCKHYNHTLVLTDSSISSIHQYAILCNITMFYIDTGLTAIAEQCTLG